MIDPFLNTQKHSNQSLLSRTWFLLWNCACNSLYISAEFINLIFISKLIWPNESFHAFELGALISLRLWIIAGFGLVWGWGIDHYPRKKVYCFGTFLTCIILLINANASVGYGYSSYIEWIGIRCLLGMAISHGGPAIHAVSNDLLTTNEKSQFFGLCNIVNTLVQIGGMLLSAWMFQMRWWRAFYAICGTLYGISTIILLLYLPNSNCEIKKLKSGQSSTTLPVNILSDLSPKSIKSTLWSLTNILIIIEGLFTNLIFGILDLMSVPYIQNTPHNISSTNTSFFLLLYGIPGGILGSMVFGKMSDKKGGTQINYRVRYIIYALILSIFFIVCMFLIPLPSLTITEGENFGVFFSYPVFFGVGFAYFALRFSFALYSVNQGPIIQDINLPETQGRIRAWNQLFEIIAYASGPLIAGFLLQVFALNYHLVVFWIVCISIPGIICWGFILRCIGKDHDRIKILQDRNSICSQIMIKNTKNK